MIRAYGPTFRWFAWHPAWTEDRGWRWLRVVYRRRYQAARGVLQGPVYGWSNTVERPPT